MAGSPAKMLEHLLETRLDGRARSSCDSTASRRSSSAGCDSDLFLDDFLLTHITFMPIHQLLTELTRQYPFSYNTSNNINKFITQKTNEQKLFLFLIENLNSFVLFVLLI